MIVGGKRQSGVLDGTPEKRLFWSIISDYNTPTAICELIDNAVDRWWLAKNNRKLRVDITADVNRQLITVSDNAGGVSEEDLHKLIAPGSSSNDPNAEMIGVFGVGSKRAAVALAEVVSIRTREGSGQTFQIDITNEWMESDDWDMPVYEVANGPEGSTRLAMSSLRRQLTSSDVERLLPHFGAVYCTFLETGRFELLVNGQNINAIRFDAWAYPKEHEPRQAAFAIDKGDEGAVEVSITAGLVRDRSPDEENYGVYFYCNGRLIVQHIKDRECGYYSGAAGVPHPDASLARAIITMDGPARLMPWNSSKTAINYSHPVFKDIQLLIVQLVSHFSSLSRRLKRSWEKDVFKMTKGSVVEVDEQAVVDGRPVYMPTLPRVQKARGEQLATRNKVTIDGKPWTLGLVEAIAAADILGRQRFHTRNRQALILLDSTFEIAMKEFIVHRTDLFPPSQYGNSEIARLFKNRDHVIAAVDAKVNITPGLLDRARHYYGLRNKLIHERATVDVPDVDIRNYRLVVQQVLQVLFGIDVTGG
jgi:Histidine kinase-, DNA gyrase B-, and HSP90-like ATPase